MSLTAQGLARRIFLDTMCESYPGSNFMPPVSRPATRWSVGSQMTGSVGEGLSSLSRPGDGIAAMLSPARIWEGLPQSSTLTGILSRELLPTLLIAQRLSGIFVPKMQACATEGAIRSGVHILGCIMIPKVQILHTNSSRSHASLDCVCRKDGVRCRCNNTMSSKR